MYLQQETLIGSWTLQAFEISYSDGRESRYPFGKHPKGRIVYTSSGHMMALVCPETASSFEPARLEDGWKASKTEKAEAFDRSMSYSGRFRIEDNTVIHSVDLAQNPAIIGTEQKRNVHLSNSILSLSYSIETKSGATALLELLWRKETIH